MLASRPSINDLAAIAHTVARANDEQTAFESIIAELSRKLQSPACVLRRTDRGWVLVAQPRGGLGVTILGLQMMLDATTAGNLTEVIDLRSIGEGIWTSMSIDDPGGRPLVILIAGDWTRPERLLEPLAISLALAMEAVREREARRAAERLLLTGYALSRRMSRLG